MFNINNCPNCGAPIQGDICEYCGTVFQKYNEKLNTYKKNIEELKIQLSCAKQRDYLLSVMGKWMASSNCMI